MRTAVNPCQLEIVFDRIDAHPGGWIHDRTLGALVNSVTKEVFKYDALGNLRYINSAGLRFIFDRDCDLLAGELSLLGFPAPGAAAASPGLVCASEDDGSGGSGEGEDPGRGACGNLHQVTFAVDPAADAAFGGNTVAMAGIDGIGVAVFTEGDQIHDETTGTTNGIVNGAVGSPPSELCPSEPATMAGLGRSQTDPFAPFSGTGGCSLPSFACDYFNPAAGDAGGSPMIVGEEGYMSGGGTDPEDPATYAATASLMLEWAHVMHIGWEAATTGRLGPHAFVAAIGMTIAIHLYQSGLSNDGLGAAIDWAVDKAHGASPGDGPAWSRATWDRMEGVDCGTSTACTEAKARAWGDYIGRAFNAGVVCGAMPSASRCAYSDSNPHYIDAFEAGRWVGEAARCESKPDSGDCPGGGTRTPHPDDFTCPASDTVCQESMRSMNRLFELVRTCSQWNGLEWIELCDPHDGVDEVRWGEMNPSACGGPYVNPGDDACSDGPAMWFVDGRWVPIMVDTGGGWTDPSPYDDPPSGTCMNPSEASTGNGALTCPEGSHPDPHYPLCVEDGCQIVVVGGQLHLQCEGGTPVDPGGDPCEDLDPDEPGESGKPSACEPGDPGGE
jgi:hypothetical protein